MTLVFLGNLNSHYSRGFGYSVISPIYCRVSDLGFSDAEHQKISIRPPMPDSVPYDIWCTDRTLTICQDSSFETPGFADISEGHVYDNRYRGDIDFTGIQIKLSLREDWYCALVNYIGHAKMPELADKDTWNGEIMFSLPSPNFSFPIPRGSKTPFTSKNVVGELKKIVQFSFDTIEVQAFRDVHGNKVGKEHAINNTNIGNLEPALVLKLS